MDALTLPYPRQLHAYSTLPYPRQSFAVQLAGRILLGYA